MARHKWNKKPSKVDWQVKCLKCGINMDYMGKYIGVAYHFQSKERPFAFSSDKAPPCFETDEITAEKLCNEWIGLKPKQNKL